jgi:hypothetical protein
MIKTRLDRIKNKSLCQLFISPIWFNNEINLYNACVSTHYEIFIHDYSPMFIIYAQGSKFVIVELVEDIL